MTTQKNAAPEHLGSGGVGAEGTPHPNPSYKKLSVLDESSPKYQAFLG